MPITLTTSSKGRSPRVHTPCLQRMQVDCRVYLSAEKPIASESCTADRSVHWYSGGSNVPDARHTIAQDDLHDFGFGCLPVRGATELSASNMMAHQEGCCGVPKASRKRLVRFLRPGYTRWFLYHNNPHPAW